MSEYYDERGIKLLTRFVKKNLSKTIARITVVNGEIRFVQTCKKSSKPHFHKREHGVDVCGLEGGKSETTNHK